MSAVIPFLLEKGWDIFEYRYEPEVFGNWYIDFFRSDVTIRLVKDRSQYSIDGARAELKSDGIGRVFTDPKEFQQAVIDWIKQSAASPKDAQPRLRP